MTIGKHNIIPKLLAVYVTCTIFLLWPAILLGGMVGASLVMTGIITTGAIIWLILANRYLSISYKRFWRTILPQVAASIIMFGFLWVTTPIITGSLIKLMVIFIISGIIYLVSVLMLTRGAVYQEAKDIIKTMQSG
jgi:hypothetical protein